MKRIVLLLSLMFLAINISLSSTPNVSEEDIDTAIIIPEVVVQVDLENLSFSFKNYTHKKTLKELKEGDLTLAWDQLKSKANFIGFKYKPIDGNQWKEVKAAYTDSSSITIPNVEENILFELMVGSGNSESSIVYDERIIPINSISATIFKNRNGKGKVEAGEISWGIELDKMNQIISVYPNATFVIKYNTKIGAKQNEKYSDKSPWEYIENIPANQIKEKIEDIPGGENYVFKVGLVLDDKTYWSKSGKFETERAWGVFKLLILIGSLGMFIFGMKIMSEGLQKAAGSRLRNMLGSITSNRIKGVFTGFGITSIVQSSSVTTVMTVSFVNAGLLTLRQSAGVMMGANIGTTITAWLILLFGFKVSIGSYALIFIAFGAPLMFFTKGKAKTWSSVIIGFSLLFMGLGYLKDSVPDLGPEHPIVQFFIDFRDVWYGPIMFVGLGALVTVIIQSSSAAMALTMTLVAGGVIPFEVASAMILGENIGTTITAEIASLIGNVHAKRSARIHSLFNLIGVTWAILLFPIILQGLALLFIDGDPYTNADAANVGLAVFHTTFNLLNVVILLPFVPWLVRMAEQTVKSKGAADEEFHLDYIGSGIMGTPDLSIYEAKKEVAKFGEITSRMSRFTQSLLHEQNKKTKTKLHEKIAKYEVITDRVEIEVATYLAKVSEGEMSEETAERVRSMNSIVNDLERIGDIYYQMSKTIERKDEHKIWFVPKQRESLVEMFELVDKAFEIMIENLNSDWSVVSIDKANAAEIAINKKRDKMRGEHLENLGNSEFNMESGMIFNNLFSSCEKVGDHIINVSEAIIGKI
ncbi:Na/Pi cotransporter family protein [Crocinitomix algicola]|uniref:Na/Pi cotransporter family protein n=1 Tax=Crocinitomix algicola TaxID=1740263 RepID=UPI000B04F098|nr:Na/Pi cotransporter family protein [Crocinitomix algicola]